MKSKTYIALVMTLLLGASSSALAADTVWTSITVKEMHCAGCAKKMAARLYTVAGVKEVRADIEKKTLIVAPTPGATLSPRAMWEAVEKSENEPIRLAGPAGTFTQKPRF